MIPRFSSSGYVDRIVIDMQRSTHYKGHKGDNHKFGRLMREVKKHKCNCYKRQKALLEVQEMIHYKQLNREKEERKHNG